uniref:Secreted protein n=1 Tax=Heterorhabditis bacteriophora TaxID=37862 RepID=A0A1I7X4E6_HETBA
MKPTERVNAKISLLSIALIVNVYTIDFIEGPIYTFTIGVTAVDRKITTMDQTLHTTTNHKDVFDSRCACVWVDSIHDRPFPSPWNTRGTEMKLIKKLME